MIYARINVNVDTGVYLFLHISCGTEYSQHSNALAHPNPSANSNKFKLLPYHCYAKDCGGFLFAACWIHLLVKNLQIYQFTFGSPKPNAHAKRPYFARILRNTVTLIK